MQIRRIALALLVASTGCAVYAPRQTDSHHATNNVSAVHHDATCVTEVDTLKEPAPPNCRQWNGNAVGAMSPRTVDALPTEFRDVSLAEVVRWALANSDVIRDAGGRVLSAADAATTIHDVAIDYTDPVFGVEAALSAFDANLSSQFDYQLNDRVFNNTVLGAGAQELQQDLVTYQTQISKVAASGTQMNLRSLVTHDRNNRVGNLFGNLWQTQWEAEVRQPLLQGAGIAFNRIAGPNGRPGLRFSNGVVIAQINNDISKVDFELAVRNFVSDVEAAYWRLYRAYQEYGSRQSTRIAAEETWQAVLAKYERGLAGGEADKEAQARAQYYLYADLALEALNGSGSTPGVYESERQLRLLAGMPVNDGEMLRPIDTISDARTVYDWDSMSSQALCRRAELRRQVWKVKQEELRLVAARNFVLPRLDASALYRLRGFGDDLARDTDIRFGSASEDLWSLEHQEWQFGLQLNVPIGQRQAYAGLRHAELRLARERAILREQELQVSHELGNAIARAAQTHSSMLAGLRRLEAAQQRLAASQAAFEADQVPLDLLLDAQERLGAAEARYYQVVEDYAIATRDVRIASGELLASNGVTLQGDCPAKWCSRPRKLRDVIDYRMQIPCPPNVGAHDQWSVTATQPAIPPSATDAGFADANQQLESSLTHQPTLEEPIADEPNSPEVFEAAIQSPESMFAPLPVAEVMPTEFNLNGMRTDSSSRPLQKSASIFAPLPTPEVTPSGGRLNSGRRNDVVSNPVQKLAPMFAPLPATRVHSNELPAGKRRDALDESLPVVRVANRSQPDRPRLDDQNANGRGVFEPQLDRLPVETPVVRHLR